MLTPEQWQKVREIFDQAVELDPAERAGFIASVAPTPEIAAAVEELLNADSQFDSVPVTAPAEAPPVFNPGTLVADRFRIVRFRGRGGMGEVYQAFDTRLKIHVGLKTIRSGTWGLNSSSLERFEREIRMAQKVSHPNLCRVHDLVEHRDGTAGSPPITCLTMEWLDGDTLQEHLNRERPMAVADALPVIRQIGHALDALHDAGIVHRDLKPGNVILEPVAAGGWRAVVTDFGLAKQTSGDELFETTEAANAGAPYFMAPELFGVGKPGKASDIYAFGLVLDEMMTSSRAFKGSSLPAIAYQRVHEDPVSPASRNPGLPSGWEAVILKCLSRTPEERYGAAGEAVKELESTAASSPRRPEPRIGPLTKLFAAGAALLLAGFLSIPARPAPSPVVVFKIANLTGDPDLQYLASALTNEITTRLFRLDGLTVRPYSGIREETPLEKFGSSYQLDGDIRQNGKRVRLSMRLHAGGTRGRLLWASTADREAGDPIALEGEMARRVMDALEEQMGDAGMIPGLSVRQIRRWIDRKGIWRRPFPSGGTHSPLAYNSYWRGRQLIETHRPDTVRAALDYFNKAIEEDPAFGLGYAALCDAYRALLDIKHGPQEEYLALAAANAEKAVRIDPLEPGVHISVAATRQMLWDWKGSEASYKEAIRLDPRSPGPYRRYGGLLLQFGRFDEALSLYRKGIEYDPYDYLAYSAYGMALQAARRYEESQKHLEWTLAQRDFLGVRINLGNAYALRGWSEPGSRELFDRALEQAEIVRTMELRAAPAGTPATTTSSDSMFALFHAMRGNPAESRKVLARMLQRPDIRKNSPTSLAQIYGMLGERQTAIEHLREAARVKDRGLLYLKVLPFWDPLRGEPGFAEVLAEMKL